MLKLVINRGKTAEIILQEDGTILKLFFKGMEHRYETERNNYQALQETNLPLAKLEQAVLIDGRQGLIFSGLGHGETLKHQLGTNFFGFRGKAEIMADLQLTLHRVKISSLNKYHEILEESLKNCSYLKHNIIPEVRRLRESLPDTEDVLCHGDFHWDNAICFQGQHYIIDLGKAHSGPFLVDVAKSWLLISLPNISDWIPTQMAKKIAIRLFIKSYLGFYQKKVGRFSRTSWRTAQILAAIEFLTVVDSNLHLFTRKLLKDPLEFDLTPFINC